MSTIVTSVERQEHGQNQTIWQLVDNGFKLQYLLFALSSKVAWLSFKRDELALLGDLAVDHSSNPIVSRRCSRRTSSVGMEDVLENLMTGSRTPSQLGNLGSENRDRSHCRRHRNRFNRRTACAARSRCQLALAFIVLLLAVFQIVSLYRPARVCSPTIIVSYRLMRNFAAEAARCKTRFLYIAAQRAPITCCE